MADITKCSAHRCPSRLRCWRYMAPSSDKQSFAMFYMSERDEKCDDFIPINPTRK